MQQLGSQQSIKGGSGRPQAQPSEEGQVESQVVPLQLGLFQSRSEGGKSRGRIGEAAQVDDGNGAVREGEGEQPGYLQLPPEPG